jgi:hypothetical protein
MKRSTLFGLGAVIGLLCSTLHAQVPQLINYQGRVVVGTTNFNGTGQFKFALVNANGSTTYWSNDGTSAAGSQPTNAVSLTVSKGLYSVLLGDTSIANMTVAIPLSVFINSDVRLRVWFNDGTTGSQLLTPDQRIASVGYAMLAATVPDGAVTNAKIANGAVSSAQIANGAVGSAQIGNGAVGSAQMASSSVGATQIADSSITAAKINTGQVVKSINSLKDAVTLAAGSNVSITPSGNTLTLASTGGVWSLNGTNAYYNAGRVALGTTTPSHQFTIATTGFTPAWTTSQWAGAVSLDNGAAIGWQTNGTWRFGMGHTGNGFYMFRTASDPGNNANPALFDFSISDAGNVGIGTTGPVSKLHVLSGAADLPPRLQSSGTSSFAAGWDFYLGSTGKGYIGVPDSSAGFAPGEMLIFGGANTPLSLWANQIRALTIDTSGLVGIGTNGPLTKVHILDSASVSERIQTTGGTNAWAKVEFVNQNGEWDIGTSRAYNGDQFYINHSSTSGTAFAVYPNGDVYTRGTMSCGVLTIRGGADVAEPFQTEDEELTKGSVVVIDNEHPGRLKRSSKAYDKRVAGIISGANGVNPGIALHQEGAMEGGQNVALSGRVYVQADASGEAIEPGDLLTTSDVPGCAMKATDYARAHGAVLGKAMTPLARGERGNVLVLVTLQ